MLAWPPPPAILQVIDSFQPNGTDIIPVDDLKSTLDTGLAQLNSAVTSVLDTVGQFQNDTVRGTVLKAIDNIQADWQAPTLKVEQTWRFIPIAVLFGVSILLAGILALAVWRMSWPKTTSFVVMLLWLDVALLMLLGAGGITPLPAPALPAGKLLTQNPPVGCRPPLWGEGGVQGQLPLPRDIRSPKGGLLSGPTCSGYNH